MANMNEENYKLYAGTDTSFYANFEEAKDAAKEFMADKVSLRIEVLIELSTNQADWWAYEYENNQWAPS